MSSINFNASAMVALDTLRDINSNLGSVQNMISTGKKVATARDNAAVWAISTVMSTDVSSFRAITDSLNLGAASVGVARSASEQVTGLLQEMKTLIVSAQEENVDRTKLQNDVTQLKDQISSIVDAAQFNGLNLLKGGGTIELLSSLDRDSAGAVSVANISVNRNDLQTTGGVFGDGATLIGATTVTETGSATLADDAAAVLTLTGTNTLAEGDSFRATVGGVDFEVIARAGDTSNDVVRRLASALSAAVPDIDVSYTTSDDPDANDVALTVTNRNGAPLQVEFAANAIGANGVVGGGLSGLDAVDVSDEAGATDALERIEGFMQTAIDASAAFGSAQNRVDIQNDFVQSLIDSMEAGISALTDANLEEASARLQSLQVQQQLNIQSLTIANQSPQAILALFR